MPYIKPAQRRAIDFSVYSLAQAIIRAEEHVQGQAGILNYVITSLLLQTLLAPDIRYADIALATGVLENVKQELYRKLAAPYEDGKCAENGEVYPSC